MKKLFTAMLVTALAVATLGSRPAYAEKTLADDLRSSNCAGFVGTSFIGRGRMYRATRVLLFRPIQDMPLRIVMVYANEDGIGIANSSQQSPWTTDVNVNFTANDYETILSWSRYGAWLVVKQEPDGSFEGRIFIHIPVALRARLNGTPRGQFYNCYSITGLTFTEEQLPPLPGDITDTDDN